MLDGLETNKFIVVEEGEGHVVVTIVGSDMVDSGDSSYWYLSC